ncbi:MAG: hypothetical protein OTJ44_03065 [Planctomycetota bacterium]|nr:hypothetical protein [Planctomycetota bacterium]
MRIIPLIPFLLLATSPLALTQQTTLATESFDYGAGPLGGQAGGSGWHNEWWSGGNFDDAMVTYPGLDGIGGAARTNYEHAGSYRMPSIGGWGSILDPDNDALGADGTSMWISFDSMRDPNSDDSYGGIVLNMAWVGEGLFIGSPWGSDEWGIEVPWVTGPTFVAGSSVDTQAHLVCRIDFLPGDERVQLWVNPASDYPTTAGDIDIMLPDFRFNEFKMTSGSGSATGFLFDDLELAAEGDLGVGLGIRNLIAGQPATITVQGAAPGNNILVAYSLTGPGPSPTPLGNVDLSAPIRQMQPFPADANGQLVFDVMIPPGTTGMPVFLQAAELLAGGGGNLSNSLAVSIQ